MWRCPVCRDLLERGGAAVWRCPTGHHFDEAREGYVNLLVTHQRKARAPGDDVEMVRARSRFLATGRYDPLLRAVLAAVGDAAVVVDAGCGEGHYTRHLPGDVWAVDISKPAVRAAARRHPDGHYAVASVFDLPLPDASAHVVVSVFGPLDAAEYRRVLRPGGRLVIAGPGPDHLLGLKQVLFDTPEAHDPPGPPQGFTRVERRRATWAMEMSGAEAAELLGMTPYWWYVGHDVRARVAALGRLRTAADVLVDSWLSG